MMDDLPSTRAAGAATLKSQYEAFATFGSSAAAHNKSGPRVSSQTKRVF